MMKDLSNWSSQNSLSLLRLIFICNLFRKYFLSFGKEDDDDDDDYDLGEKAQILKSMWISN